MRSRDVSKKSKKKVPSSIQDRRVLVLSFIIKTNRLYTSNQLFCVFNRHYYILMLSNVESANNEKLTKIRSIRGS